MKKFFQIFNKIIFFQCVFLVSIWAGGPSGEYSVSDLIKRALGRSEIIFAQKLLIEEKSFFKKHKAAWMNPSMDLSLGRKNTDGTNGVTFDMSIFQPFYYPGKQKLRSEVVEMAEKMAGLSLIEVKLAIRYEVLRLAYEFIVAREKSNHAQERVERFRLMQRFMRGRPFVSPKKRVERDIVEKKLLIFQKELFKLRSRQDIIWERLNVYLDYPEKIHVKAALFKRGIDISLERFMREAMKNNTSIRFRSLKVKKSIKEKKLSEKEAYPDFGISAYYSRESARERDTFFGAGITFVLPVLNRNQNQIRSLSSRIKSEKLRMDFEKRLVRQRLKARFREYTAARKILQKLPLSLIKRLHSQLAYADREFRRGRLDLLTFLEMESGVFNTHIAIFNAQLDYVKDYITLLSISVSTNFQTEGIQDVK